MFEKVATLVTLILIGIQLGAASNDVTLRGSPNSHHSNSFVDEKLSFSLEDVKTNEYNERTRSLGGKGGKRGKKSPGRKRDKSGKENKSGKRDKSGKENKSGKRDKSSKGGKKKKKNSKSDDGPSPCPKEKLFLSRLYINVTGNPSTVFTETEALERSVEIAYDRLLDPFCRRLESVKLVGYELTNGTVMEPSKTASRFLEEVDDDDLDINYPNFSIINEIVFNCPSCPDNSELLRPDASRRRWRSRELPFEDDTCTCGNESSDDSASNEAPPDNEFVAQFNRVIEEQENIISVREAFDVESTTVLLDRTLSPTISPNDSPSICPLDPPRIGSECNSDNFPESCNYDTFCEFPESNPVVFIITSCTGGKIIWVTGDQCSTSEPSLAPSASPVLEECPLFPPDDGSRCNSDSLPESCSYATFCSELPESNQAEFVDCFCTNGEISCQTTTSSCCPKEEPEDGSTCNSDDLDDVECKYIPYTCPGSNETQYDIYYYCIDGRFQSESIGGFCACPDEPPFSTGMVECDSDFLPDRCSYETVNCTESNQAEFSSCTCEEGQFSCVSGIAQCEGCPDEPPFSTDVVECDSDSLPDTCSYETANCIESNQAEFASCTCEEGQFSCVSSIAQCEECPEGIPFGDGIGSECNPLVLPESCQYEAFRCPGLDDETYLTECTCLSSGKFFCTSATVECSEGCPEEIPANEECNSKFLPEVCQYEPFSCPGSDNVTYLTKCTCRSDESDFDRFLCSSVFIQCREEQEGPRPVERSEEFTAVGEFIANKSQP